MSLFFFTSVEKSLTETNWQCRYKRNNEARSPNQCCWGKAISIKYSECVFVALVIQHAKCMRHSHMWPLCVYHICPHYLINSTTVRKSLLTIKCLFWFSLKLLPENFFILRRIQRYVILAHRSDCKVPVISVRFWWNLNLLDRFSKNNQIPNFMKIRPVGAELYHMYRQTDRHTWRS
jgi:hypothetical protein